MGHAGAAVHLGWGGPAQRLGGGWEELPSQEEALPVSSSCWFSLTPSACSRTERLRGVLKQGDLLGAKTTDQI